jgi:hypothetical protein
MKKFLKKLLTPWVYLFFWITYLLSFWAGVIRYHYIQNPTTDFLIIGKTASFFWHIQPAFLIVFLGSWTFWVWNRFKNNQRLKGALLFYAIGISSILIFVFANYLLNLEFSKYSNYLYSTYGITKASAYWLSNTSLITAILFGVSVLYNRSKSLRDFKFTNKLAIVTPVLLILAWNSLMTFAKARGFFSYLQYSYEKEFENYNEIVALKDFTDENATIILPPQSSKYPAISNPPLVRYFLFPRTLVSSSYVTDQEIAEKIDRVFFITLNKEGESVWPEIDKTNKTVSFADGYYFKYSKLTLVTEVSEEVVYELEF